MGRRRWQREELHYIRKQPSSMHKTSCVCVLRSLTCKPACPVPGWLHQIIGRAQRCSAMGSSTDTCKNYPQLLPSPQAQHFITLIPHTFQVWG